MGLGASRGPSYYELAQQGYEQLKNAIIRPHRHVYAIDELGPKSFEFGGVAYRRSDVTLVNPRGLSICASHWEPASDRDRPARTEARPTVVFLHGNSSSRVEAKSILSCCLAVGASVFAIDFAGSGHSEGEYVSLGYHEQGDVAAVMRHLRARGCKRVVLWGRSMGAATTLMYAASLSAAETPEAAALSAEEKAEREADGEALAGLVLDSPFSDFTTLAEEQVQRARDSGVTAPGMLVSLLMSYLADAVKESAGFDPRDLRPIDGAERATKPALFIVARDDRFVTPSHGRGIHEKYGADKGLLLVRGSHNTPRPAGLFDASIGFLRHCLRVPATLAQPRGVTPHNDLLPPWESLQRMREEALAAAEMRSAQRLPQAVQSAHATLRAARRSDSSDGHVDKRARLNSSSDDFDDLGMTEERQQNVTAGLATMLGGGAAAAAAEAPRPQPAPAAKAPAAKKPSSVRVAIDADQPPSGTPSKAARKPLGQASGRTPLGQLARENNLDALSAQSRKRRISDDGSRAGNGGLRPASLAQGRENQ